MKVSTVKYELYILWVLLKNGENLIKCGVCIQNVTLNNFLFEICKNTGLKNLQTKLFDLSNARKSGQNGNMSHVKENCLLLQDLAWYLKFNRM